MCSSPPSAMSGRPELPMDLADDILLRLQQAKDLLRCKAVSKDWYDLITSHRFIKKHHESHKSAFIATTIRKDIMSFSLDGLKHPLYLPPPVKAVLVPAGSSHRLGLVGSCNGLLCLLEDKLVHVWNPTTRECRQQQLFSASSDDVVDAIGFGYDAITDDYKVVKINKATTYYYVEVWSMSTHAWRRKVNELPKKITDEYRITCRSGLFVGRNLYWLAKSHRGPYNKNDLVVISFDMGDETFDTIAVPETAFPNKYRIRYRPTLVDYMGSLALPICIRARKRRRMIWPRERRFAIWILDMDNSNSWIQPFSTGPFQVRFSVQADLCMKGKFVIQTQDKYWLHDAAAADNKMVELQVNPCADIPLWVRCPYDRLHWSFVESLVSVKSINRNNH